MNILEKIVADSRADLAAAKCLVSAGELTRKCRGLPPRPSLAAACRGSGVQIIAEVKKASPSRGVISADFRPVETARAYERGGASAISVLTERHHFLGSLADLQAVSQAVHLPLLRKDFIFDPYQLLEARHCGASAVLLIAALLDRSAFLELTLAAHDLGLEVLGEVHAEEELEVVLAAQVDLVGINARDLRTFATSLERTERLLGRVPAERLPVAESAIRTRADILRLAAAGAAGFLIGETLMRAADQEAAVRRLICGDT